MKISLPIATPVAIDGGQTDPLWIEQLQNMARVCNLFSEVNVAALTNGQVFIWDATLKKFVPGAN